MAGKEEKVMHDGEERHEENVFADYTNEFTNNDGFQNRDEVVNWVPVVGYRLGFVVVVLKSDLGLGKCKRQRVVFGCQQSGVYKAYKANLKYNTESRRINCPFRLSVKPSRSGDKWTLKVKCGFHNHKENESLVGHSLAGRLTGEQCALVIDLTKSSVKSRRLLSTLKQRYPNNLTTIKQINNARTQYKRSVRRPHTQLQHLLLCLAKEGYEYSHITYLGSEVAKDIFWAHPTSISLLCNFSLVIIMDNIYKIDIYRLPLLEIVGKTSICKTFFAAFCYMSAENHDSFLWALKQFCSFFAHARQYMKFTVTDFEGALVRVVEDVFLPTRIYSVNIM